jgi:tRNA threonylcarbamoyl adenosine modification protein YeaZ
VSRLAAWPTLGRVPDAALVLAVDTSTPAVTAALVEITALPAPGPAAAPSAGWSAGLRLLAQQVAVDPRRHGELLAPAVAATLAAAGRVAGDLTAVVAGLGPGPYTGLRVGLVTAAALADALGIPVYGVCSLDAVALPAAARPQTAGEPPVLAESPPPGVPRPGPGRLLAATDARRREIYWAVYDRSGARLAGPAVERPAELAGRLAGLGVTAMCGAGARQYAEVLALPLLAADYPAPLALASLARGRVLAGAPADGIAPLYLRRPDAVEPGRPKAVTPA